MVKHLEVVLVKKALDSGDITGASCYDDLLVYCGITAAREASEGPNGVPIPAGLAAIENYIVDNSRYIDTLIYEQSSNFLNLGVVDTDAAEPRKFSGQPGLGNPNAVNPLVAPNPMEGLVNSTSDNYCDLSDVPMENSPQENGFDMEDGQEDDEIGNLLPEGSIGSRLAELIKESRRGSIASSCHSSFSRRSTLRQSISQPAEPKLGHAAGGGKLAALESNADANVPVSEKHEPPNLVDAADEAAETGDYLRLHKTVIETEDQEREKVSTLHRQWYGFVTSHIILLLVLMDSFLITLRVSMPKGTFPDSVAYAEMGLDVLNILLHMSQFVLPVEVDGKIVTDVKTLAKMYLKSDFSYHFVALFPLQLIFFALGDFQMVFMRVNRLLLIKDYPRRFAFFTETHMPSVHPTVIRIINFCLFVVVSTNFTNCIASYVFLHSTQQDNEEWYDRTLPLNDNQPLMFLIGWEQTLRVISGRDIPYPKTENQHIASVIILAIGVAVSSTVIASVTQMVVTLVEQQAMLPTKEEEARAEMTRLKLPEEYQHEVVTYYRRMWSMSRSFDSEASQDIFADLPQDLLNEVIYATNIGTIQSIPLFQHIADFVFVKDLAMSLDYTLFLPGSQIVQKGEDGNRMYFLTSGEAVVLDDDLQPVYVLTEGSYFGEVTVLFGGVRAATIVSNTLCHCHSLSREQFESLMVRHPQALEGILVSAVQMLRAAHDMEEDMDDGDALQLLSECAAVNTLKDYISYMEADSRSNADMDDATNKSMSRHSTTSGSVHESDGEQPFVSFKPLQETWESKLDTSGNTLGVESAQNAITRRRSSGRASGILRKRPSLQSSGKDPHSENEAADPNPSAMFEEDLKRSASRSKFSALEKSMEKTKSSNKLHSSGEARSFRTRSGRFGAGSGSRPAVDCVSNVRRGSGLLTGDLAIGIVRKRSFMESISVDQVAVSAFSNSGEMREVSPAVASVARSSKTHSLHSSHASSFNQHSSPQLELNLDFVMPTFDDSGSNNEGHHSSDSENKDPVSISVTGSPTDPTVAERTLWSASASF